MTSRLNHRRPTLTLTALTICATMLAPATGARAAPEPPDGATQNPASHAVRAWNDDVAKVNAKVAAINRIRQTAERQPDHFAGVSTNGPDDVTVNLVAGAAVSADLAVMERDAAANGITLKRKFQRYSLRELTRVEAAISKSYHPGVTLGSLQINPDTNSVEVGLLNTVDSVSANLRSSYGDRVSVASVEPLRQLYGRFNDVRPFYAGNRIRVDGMTPCTSGFTITNLYGYRFALTAGHCAPQTDRPTVRLLRASGSHYDDLGTVDYRRHGGGNLDNALIGVDRYAGHMWSSPNLADDTTQFLPVNGAADSCDGCQVYFNGSYTGIALATLRGAPGCQTTTGGYSCGLQRADSATGNRICQGGDSGGPVFAHDGRGGVVAVGIITAGNSTGTICYYTRVTSILAYWQSTIA